MKKNIYLLIAVLGSFTGIRLSAQNSSLLQKPTLITRSENMIEVPSIASQIASGTFIPAENKVKEFNPKRWGSNATIPGKGLPMGDDPLWQKQAKVTKTSGNSPILVFEAASASATPTDPTGAVGPNHFVNSWNTSFRVWDKAGNPLTAAASLSTLFSTTDGDPIVMYDPFADRFLITEFYNNGFKVAISKGPDPVTSGWYTYAFATSSFPDYPKFSVWSDGYYITANKDQGSPGTSQVVFALERDKMIAGNPTVQMIGFPLTGIAISGFYSPLGFNANGPAMPPAGNAPIIYMQDDAWSGVSADHLKIWLVNVDWTTPANSTISSPQILNTQPFDGVFDSGSFSNLPQPSGSDIDALQATIMYMAQYRRFPSYNAAVFNFVVDLDGNDNKAGIRWYELRQTTDGAPWTIYQEGTYSQPNGHSAFCGNMCMDIDGNIGLAYTTVSTTQVPSLRFTGRYASDPLGTMTLAEEVIFNGTSIDPASRYGDYAQMTIDPVDGKTLWSIGEAFSGGRKNWVGVFKIAPPALTAQFSGTPLTVCTGGSVVFTDQSLSSPTLWSWSFPGGTPSTYVGQNPPAIIYNTAGTYDVTLSVTNGTDTDSEVKTGYITVKNVVADFSGTPVTVIVGNPVTFADNSSCGPSTWDWSFQGGSPSSFSGQTPPAIIYNTTGTYNVSLTVTNLAGSDTKTKTGYITVVPPIFNITNGAITTCSGDFYDTGGPTGVYQDNETLTETFYPSTSGAMVRFAFSSFSTESGFDTLTIYNGINSSAPIIGKYHGTTSPGTVIASNVSGALTFRFHSDGSQTYTGWAAAISCVTGIVTDPVSFIATTASPTQINLGWVKNNNSDDVMITWSATNSFGAPIDGTAYSTGTMITGGGTVLYRGSLTAFNHTLLNSNTTYYYKAFSYNGSNNYSPGVTATAVTLCGIRTLPFSENFAGSTLPDCWTKQFSGTNATDKWTVSNTANAGGTANEMKSTFQSVSPGITRLVTPPINTLGISPLILSFKHMLDAFGTGCTLRIQSSSDGITWTNEAWSIASTSSNVGPETVNTTIVNNLNSPNTYVAFTVEGNLYQYDYWYIDAVSITNGCSAMYPVSVSISRSADNICAGSPVTFTASPGNGGTMPAYQWIVNGANAGENSASFAYAPANNDVISCVLTSNALCTTGNPATSNSLTMTVNPVVPVSVSIEVSANPVYDGSPVTFTATAMNEGISPVYQWQVNNMNAGSGTNSYLYVPVDGDSVSCVLTSSESCPAVNPVTSNKIIMTVYTVPIFAELQDIEVNGTECYDATQTIQVAGNGTTFFVISGGSATMIAGRNIIFSPGTSVQTGGYLYGHIVPGGPWCIEPSIAKVMTGTNTFRQERIQPFYRIFPNPTNGVFLFELKTTDVYEKCRVEIYDMRGEKISSNEMSGERRHEFSLSGYPSGLYLIRVTYGNLLGSSRIIRTE